MANTGTYFTVARPFEAEYRAKDSRFLARIAPAASKDAAERFVKQAGTAYADATHNCSAYRIGSGDRCVYRADDAGEPAGTAGKPILQALERRHVSDAAIVVSRYFGGTKLGIGGLIRAYGGAAFAVLDHSELIEVVPTIELIIEFDYKNTGAVHQVLQRMRAKIIRSDYVQNPTLKISIRQDAYAQLLQALQDATRGGILIR